MFYASFRKVDVFYASFRKIKIHISKIDLDSEIRARADVSPENEMCLNIRN